MGGGTGNGGSLTGEQLGSRRESRPITEKKTERFARVRTVAKKSAILLTPIALASGTTIAWDKIDAKNNRISELSETVENKETMLDAAVTLGSAGVRFSNVKLIDHQVVVEVPGTTSSCQTINFNYSNTAEGWTLSIEQPDAAGQIYDTAKAHNAESVNALVEDLCS